MEAMAAMEAALPSGDALVDAKIQAMQALHAQKVKILMKSINNLKEEILALKGQQTSSRQTKIINSMRQKLREQELVTDVLKEELQSRGMITVEDANELIIRKTLGGPKRFRPKIREELQNELAALEKKYNRALERIKKFQQQQPPPPPPLPAGGVSNPSEFAPAGGIVPGTPMSQISHNGGGGVIATVDLEQVGALLEQVESLRVAVRSRDLTLQRYMDEVERARSELRELRMLQDRVSHSERRCGELKDRNRELETLYQKSLQAQETSSQELEQLRAETELYREEYRVENEALKKELLDNIVQIRELLDANNEMEGEIKTLREAASADARAHSQALRFKEAEVADLRKQVRDLSNRGGDAESKSQKMETALAEANKEVQELRGLREKLRDVNVARADLEKRVKDLTDRLAATHKKHQEEVSVKDKSIQELQVQLSHANGQVNGLQEEIGMVKSSSEAALKEAHTASESLSSTKAAHDKLKAENDKLKTEVASKEDAMHTLRSSLADSRSLAEAMRLNRDSVEAEYKAFKATTQTEIKTSQDRIAALTKDKGSLEQKLIEAANNQAVQGQMTELTKAKEQALADAVKLRSEVTQLSEQCQLLQEGLNKATAEKVELDKKVHQMGLSTQTKVANLQKDITEMQSEMERLDNSVKETEAALEESQKELEDSQRLCEAKDQQIASLESEVAATKEEYLKKLPKEKAEMIRKLQGDANQLRGALRTARENHEKLTAKATFLERLLESHGVKYSPKPDEGKAVDWSLASTHRVPELPVGSTTAATIIGAASPMANTDKAAAKSPPLATLPPATTDNAPLSARSDDSTFRISSDEEDGQEEPTAA